MVIQRAVDNLKEKPKDDKKAVAGGIAIMIMAILFFGWAFMFVKKIQRGTTELQFGGTAQDDFNFSNVRQAQDDLMNDYSREDELLEARRRQQQSGGSTSVEPDAGGGEDPFGGSGSIE
jgi:hypothetical protein